MLTIKAMSDGENYAARHLSNNDYYSVGETVTGHWIGNGAKRLGLEGEVNLDDFEKIRKGLHPETGEFLRPRQSADRFSLEDGKQIGTARSLYDFTISAPKAISIQAMDDSRLLEAHNIAARETMVELEQLAGTRVRRAGANTDRETDNLVIAAYQHDTSRELDPQIHTHFVAANFTFDPAENKWKALQASEIYREREYLTEVYRNALARETINCGYRLQDHFPHGRDNGFGIEGIAPETLEKFSRRSKQRDAAIQDFLERNGRLPSNDEVAILVRDSRPEKLTEITTAEVKVRQKERLTPEEAQTLSDLHLAAQERSPVSQDSWDQLAALVKQDRQIQGEQHALDTIANFLENRISSEIGGKDPYWEEWYDAVGRPLEDSPAAAKSPWLFEHINALNERYEAWRVSEVAVDMEKLSRFQEKQAEIGLRESALLKERLALKIEIRDQTAAYVAAQRVPAEPSFRHASDHIFERVSVAKEYEIHAEALRHGRGRLDLGELKTTLRNEIVCGNMLTAHGEVATLDSLERERRMVQTINDGIGRYESLARREFVVFDRMRPEQKEAVLQVLDSHDLAINLQGAAGTGKTTTLQELQRGLHESKRSVMAIAPTASAVEELQKVGFKDAMTISRLMADPRQQEALRGQILVVDEAGMVASKDMESILKLAKIKEARIVFSGDTAQIKSVSEGDALRVLERESNLKRVSLLQVQRQTNQDYRTAVEALRSHPADGYALLEAMGAIREVDWRLRSQEVAQEYRAAKLIPNLRGEERTVLVVAATHNEIKNVTYAIRQDRKRSGELAAGEMLDHQTSLGWTQAQKRQAKNYQPGQVIEFHKAVKGVAEKHDTFEVVKATQAGLTVQRNGGQQLRLSTKHAASYDMFEREAIEVSAGDKLLLQSNWRDKNLRATNGELVTVSEVKDGHIRLEDGRQLPGQYRQFSHGYAVTAHRSQGKTVDFEIIAAERMAQDLFYVSATRGREGLKVITSDSLALQESIGISGDRQSATELAREAARMKRDRAEEYYAFQAQHQEQRPKQEMNYDRSTPGIHIAF